MKVAQWEEEKEEFVLNIQEEPFLLEVTYISNN